MKMVLMDSELSSERPVSTNLPWPRSIKNSQRILNLPMTWELPKPTCFS
jgi:hypothetical protein